MSPSIARLLVVEDHLIVRDALVTLLTLRHDFQVVGVAASIRETKPLLEQTVPDVLLLDLALEDGSGLELARMLRRTRSKTHVLILTGFRDGFAAAEAIAAGVAGYVLKEQPTADLFAAIDIVRRGERYVCPTILAQLTPDQLSGNDDGLLASLSPRESEIFRLIVAGTRSGDISRRLFISAKTVDTHRTNIGRKLGVRTGADLVRFAAAHGIAIAPLPGLEDLGGSDREHTDPAVAAPVASAGGDRS